MKNLLITLLAFNLLIITNVKADEREPIWVDANEKAMILKEMRGFFEGNQKILEAALKNDMKTVYKEAKALGEAQTHNVPKETKAKLPSGFLAMSPLVHMTYEDIAYEATTMGDTHEILTMLSNVQKACISCHNTYRLVSNP